ncbi:hypothetical protein COE53_19825 [Bacillus sp. AFS029533]|nr:hypothetical protein COE53_19825 [Bacillus sp. AFS029533]SFC66729.1 hypothetical protein SAMN02799633_01237 [Bacillus sp. UNCCL81]
MDLIIEILGGALNTGFSFLHIRKYKLAAEKKTRRSCVTTPLSAPKCSPIARVFLFGSSL